MNKNQKSKNKIINQNLQLSLQKGQVFITKKGYPVANLWVRTLVRLLFKGQIRLRATELVYATLVSLVPLLAFSFALLKAFGAHNAVEPLLLQFLEPLGAEAKTVSKQIVVFVSNIKVGVLGSLGLFLLLYTSLSLIQRLEFSFNHIWQVQKPRKLTQRLSEYLSVMMIAPVCLFVALGSTATIGHSSWLKTIFGEEMVSEVIWVVARLLPNILIFVGFSFLYYFLPNTQVKLKPALWAGLLGTLAWQIASFIFAKFVNVASNFNAIYSGFAILIFLLLWMHISAVILLMGCQVAYFLQYPSQLQQGSVRNLSWHAEYALALDILSLIQQRFEHGENPYSEIDLAQTLSVPLAQLAPVMAQLMQLGFVVEIRSDSSECLNCWIPALPHHKMSPQAVYLAMGTLGEIYLPQSEVAGKTLLSLGACDLPYRLLP